MVAGGGPGRSSSALAWATSLPPAVIDTSSAPDPTALAHDAGGDLVRRHRREPVHVDGEASEAQVGVDVRVLLDGPGGEAGEQPAVQHVG